MAHHVLHVALAHVSKYFVPGEGCITLSFLNVVRVLLCLLAGISDGEACLIHVFLEYKVHVGVPVVKDATVLPLPSMLFPVLRILDKDMSDAASFGTSMTGVRTNGSPVSVTARLVPNRVTCNISFAPVITNRGVSGRLIMWKVWECAVI